MYPRFVFAALVVGALALPMAAQDKDEGNGDGLSCERVCQFKLFVPPILECSDCKVFTSKDGMQLAVIDVRTNSRVKVCVSATEFSRMERDCDGNLLSTKDVLESALSVRFWEIIHCEGGGAPLQIKDLGESCFCLAPHRGGFQIELMVNASTADICDDAGCYTATARITITADPVEDCID
jgi:hypothetical protein